MQTATNQINNDLKYRPDIDGLRAFAVLSVLGFHAFPRWFPGGFIGVDVFFVISGFLISTIILTGLQKNSFSLKTFYGKRIKRIFPALLLVLVSIGLLGWLILTASEYETLAKHSVGGAVFASNFTLMSEAGYFDKAAILKPLLHLWSLSIEEQFYIFWPLLLVVLWKTKLPLAISLGALIILSFGHSISSLQTQPIAAFYLLQNRAWELAIGGLLAVLLLFHRPQLRSIQISLSKATKLKAETVHSVLAFSGLLLLVAAVFFFNASQPYPGCRALLPTVGAFLIITAGKEAWVNNKLLSHRLIVGIGLISFPLYLWHWPLLSLLHILKRDYPSSASRILVLVLSFFLACLTYLFIEKPIRFGEASALKIPLLCLSMVGVACFGVSGWIKLVAPRSNSYGLERFGRASYEWAFPQKIPTGVILFQGNYVPFQFEGTTFYSQLDRINKNKVLYIGDSQMQVAASRIAHLISTQPQNQKSAVFATNAGCPPIPNVKKTNNSFPPCEEYQVKALSYASRSEVDTVVIGAYWSWYFSSDDFCYEEGNEKYPLRDQGAKRAWAALEKMCLALKQQHKKVYLMLQVPMGEALNPTNMVVRDFDFRRLKFDFKVVHSNGITRTDLSKKYGAIEATLRKIAQRTGASIIDPKSSFCGVEVCPAVTKSGDPMYRDTWHIAPSYMATHGTFIDQTLRADHNSIKG